MKKKFSNLFTIVFLCAGLLFTFTSCESSKQEFLATGEVPFTADVKTDVLENGLTYYVKSNSEPKNRISIKLVVNAGSCNEDDDQKGIAHLCEHMAFEGTEHFGKNDIDTFFREIGSEEENAFTNYSNTVYHFEIPADNKEVFEKAMLIIHDWASSVSFEEEALDKERQIVIEEWRLGQNVNNRINNILKPYTLEGSRYLEREVIGDPEIIKNISRQRVVDFYKKWYRPELMSVVVVGDLPEAELEKTVVNAMKDIPASETKIEKNIYTVPVRQEKAVVIAKDAEWQNTLVNIDARLFDYTPYTTVEQYKNEVIFNFAAYIFNERMEEITKKSDSPWLGAGINQKWYATNAYALYLYFFPKEGMFEQALKSIIDEYERFMKYGVTKSELDRIRFGYNVEMENYKKKISKTTSDSYSWDFVSHFEHGATPISPEYYYEMTKAFIKNVTNEDIMAAAQKYFGNRGDLITVVAPEAEKGIPSKEQIMKIWAEYKDENLAALEEDSIKDKIMDAPKAAKVKSKKAVKELGATEYVFENGVRVIIKKTDFEKDKIMMNAVSKGGSALVSDDEFASSEIASVYQSFSGIEGFTKTELDKFLTTKTVSVDFGINKWCEYFSGNSNNADVEVMLQYINQIFTNPQFTQEAWDLILVQFKEAAKNTKNQPDYYYSSKIKELAYDNSRNYVILTDDFVNTFDKTKAEKTFRERFGNIADFDFVFVGDIDEKKLVDLCAKYLGTVKGDADAREQNKFEYFNLPSGVQTAYVNKASEHKATVDMFFRGNLPAQEDICKKFTEQTLVNEFMTSLQTQLFDYIRKELGGTYGIGAHITFDGYPERQYTVNISFGCEPERVEELTNAIISYINSLKENGVEESYVLQEAEGLRRSVESSLNKNGWWMNRIKGALVDTTEPVDVVQQYKKDIPDEITKENFDRIAKEYIDTNNYYKIVLMPEN